MNLLKPIFYCLLTVTSFAMLTDASAGSQPLPYPLEKCEAWLIYKKPQIETTNSTVICRTGYLLLHDNLAKIPVWVTYVLKPDDLLTCNARSNAFSSDRSLKSTQKSMLEDYSRSGYDTGHIAPAGDMLRDEIVEKESFILSNTAPQTPELNRGAWRTLELAVRSWAYNNSTDLVIHAGPIYDIAQDKTIGPNNVVVPHAYYKIIIDTNKNQSLAFIFENGKITRKDLGYYQVTVADVERTTGIKFDVPDYTTYKNDIWTINTVILNIAKKKLCNP